MINHFLHAPSGGGDVYRYKYLGGETHPSASVFASRLLRRQQPLSHSCIF